MIDDTRGVPQTHNGMRLAMTSGSDRVGGEVSSRPLGPIAEVSFRVPCHVIFLDNQFQSPQTQ